MDINLLPMELLQKILSYLCYGHLKEASLVCHRWNQASEARIIRNGQFHLTEQAAAQLDVIRNCVRNYQNICLYRMDEWSNLQAVTTECAQRFPNVRRLNLAGCLQDYLHRFYVAYRGWVERCETLRISMDDRFADHLHCGPEDFELTLPMLKQLHWAECLYGHGEKTVTINAPKLEKVYVDDSLDASSVVRIPMCDQIRFIRCMLYTKHFDDTFLGNVSNVETLIVDAVYGNCDISYLTSMHQLRYLKLGFGSANTSLQDVEAMHDFNRLKVLSITIQDSNSERGSLNLNKVFNNFTLLETLELRAIDLKTTGSIQAKHLKLLKLRDVTCSTSTLFLQLPRLKTLSVPAIMLTVLQLDECDQFNELYIDLETSSMKQSFEQVANHFIQNHKNLKKLILYRGNYQLNRIEDDAVYESKNLQLERLELHYLDVSIDFFRVLSEWKSLKTLIIVGCSINCRPGGTGRQATPTTIHLPSVKRMTLDCVKLRGGTSGSDFPLQIGDCCELRCISVSSTLLYSTVRQMDSKYRRFDPFVCDKIDPLH